MRRLGTLFLLAASFGLAETRLIFDTDMGNDIDDALALAMIHALETRGEARLLAVTITKDNPYAAAYVDLVNTFYGRGRIPIGVVRNGKTPEDSAMIRVPVERNRWPRKLKSGAEARDAVPVLRQALEAQPDESVVIVQVGFSTNLALLLDSLGGPELVRKKVKMLVTMAGQFPTGKAEYNVKTDIFSAKRVFSKWPTPIVTSGFEIGEKILYPASSIEKDFAYAEHHPIADAYRAYQKMPYDRPTWDLTAVLWAVRSKSFSRSPEGRILVDDRGVTTFERKKGGHQWYLTLNEQQRAAALEQMIELASARPQLR